MAVARDLSGGKNNVIAVIGDGAMSAGMAYEAMNNAGAMNSRLIVILNDNDMSIAPPVGAMSAYLSRLYSGKTYRTLREAAKQLGTHLPKIISNRASRVEEYSRGFMMDGGTLFEELGFYYVGPIDGHNLDHLLPVLKNVRDMETGPILVHVVTQKGKGYGPAEASADKYHAVVKFDVATGTQAKAKPNAPAYQNVFGQSLVKEAQKDDKIVGITATMPSGTGIDIFNEFAGPKGVPQVVTGFEPLDLLMSVYMLAKQVKEGRSEVENEYPRVVRPEGNLKAREMLAKAFRADDRAWRGFPITPSRIRSRAWRQVLSATIWVPTWSTARVS